MGGLQCLLKYNDLTILFIPFTIDFSLFISLQYLSFLSLQTRLDLVDITILQLVDGEISIEQLINSKRNMVRKELYFRLAELANAGTTPVEKQR